MRTNYCRIVSAKNTKKEPIIFAGSIHLVLLSFLMLVFVGGGIYLYSVNKNAVQGYHMRTLEKEIASLKQENENLRINEADTRSLYHMETVTEDLHMKKIEDPSFIEDTEENIHDRSVALR